MGAVKPAEKALYAVLFDKFRLLSGISLDEKIACPHCLTINPPLSYFCITCMAPLTSHACIDPIYRIYAQGNTYQKAAAKPTNSLVALGMWLIFGTQFFYMAFISWGLLNKIWEPNIHYANTNHTKTVKCIDNT